MGNFSRRRFVLGAGLVLSAVGGPGWAQPLKRDVRAGDVSAAKIDLASANEPLRRLYGAESAPLWQPETADDLEQSLRAASAHGLDPQPYLELIDASGSTGDRDLNLSMSALAYAKALAKGLVDPQDIFGIYTPPHDEPDLVSGLRSALAQRRVAEWLGSLAPQDTGYHALSTAYADWAARSGAAVSRPIPSGPLIRPGDEDARRRAIIVALAREGVTPEGSGDGAVWTLADADRLKVYQRARGLAADGVVGPNTLALLNATPRDKARRLAVNLERLRWLQRHPPPTRIDVNTAASTLAYIVDGQIVWTSVVVPGRPGHETPQLQASFERLVLNPPWYVPASIAREEITPRGPAYLARHHMRREGSRIIQSPGPWAALGAVKFDMQDRYAIYLHDTPSKAMFKRSQRHLSHGCVRVQGAVDFARRLATSRGEGARFERILTSGRTGVVHLGAPIPVRLIYQTALAGEDGAVTFRPDVYGWDVRTAEAMGLAPPEREGVEPITAAPLGP